MMYQEIIQNLKKIAQSDSARKKTIFFKTAQGEYAEGDYFLGITAPDIRKIAKQYQNASLKDITLLLHSRFNEERLLALIILVSQYKKKESKRELIYSFFLDHIDYVNNWNLVDSSAHLIVGSYCYHTKNHALLFKLAQSNNMWHRRIAMVATWYFIRKGSYDIPVLIAEQLLTDNHDLIHKAVGWMLREVGKKDINALLTFLEKHASEMPRTTLRYAIEKLDQETKRQFMQK